MFFRRISPLITITALTLGVATAHAQTPLGTAFTYQGQLKDSASPVNGTANFQFQLWNAASAGVQQGSTITQNGVPVSNGLFTVLLDFGVSPYTTNQSRWLQVSVNGQTLLPRQALTPAPFAISTRGVAVDSSGNVGIGTSSPVGPLTLGDYLPGTIGSAVLSYAKEVVVGGAYNTAYNTGTSVKLLISGYDNDGTSDIYPIYCEDENNGVDFFVRNQVGTRTAYFGGNLGIGTVNPVGQLCLGDYSNPGSSVAAYGKQLVLAGPNNAGTNSGSSVKLLIEGYDNEAPADIYPIYVEDENNVAEFYVRNLHSNSAGGSRTAYFGGSVGIGTTTPQATLDVNGTTRTKVIEIMGGSDVAEPYEIAAAGTVRPSPGMVVSIDPNKVGSLQVCSTAYDSRIAGVISGARDIQPGLILRQKGTIADGLIPVANMGRLWCLADADASGPISAGDLLTSSATPGHAMKAADRSRAAGAVLGKAMSSLQSGRGLVLVLVGLQ